MDRSLNSEAPEGASGAEREGFEPPLPVSKAVFKTAAFNRSATSPVRVRVRAANIVRIVGLGTVLSRDFDHTRCTVFTKRRSSVCISFPVAIQLRCVRCSSNAERAKRSYAPGSLRIAWILSA